MSRAQHRPRTAAARRRRVQRHARGAVFIESLIVCGFIIVVLICGLYVHRVCATKLRVMNEARTAAWVFSKTGCGATPVGVQSLRPLAQSFNASAEPSVGDDALNGTLTFTPQSATRSRNVEGARGLRPMTVVGNRSVACNETPGDDSGAGSLASIFSANPF